MEVVEDISDTIREQHKDLGRKWQLHSSKIEEFWRSFDRQKRAKAFRAGALEGQVLRNPNDKALGNVYKVIPELNLRDIAESGPDYLLNYMRFRATTSLHDQYIRGVNNGPGDHGFIINSMRVNYLRHANSFPNCFTMFFDDREEFQFGRSYECSDEATYRHTITNFAASWDAGFIVPQSTGELILQRLSHTFLALNILVEDILDIGSKTRDVKPRPKKSEDTAVAALSKLSIAPKPAHLSLQDVLSSALEHKSTLEEYLSLCRMEPDFLSYTVNIWFFTRPELVMDEKGQKLPMFTDKYISIAFFEMIHNAIAGAAIWNYLCRLLQLFVDKSGDKILKSTILQELANVCHLEYSRDQKLFKRMVQLASGSKCFKRISGVYDNGTARVTMKIKPEIFTATNPQLHYMLRLCQPDTNATKAIAWIKKLDDLHKSHPQERDGMEEREWNTFADLVVAASFTQSISTLLPLPSVNARKGQSFVSRFKELAIELGSLASKVDLANFAIPIDNLKEPKMAEGALNALSQFIIENTGTTMGFLYQDLVDECVADIQTCAQQHKEKLEQNLKSQATSTTVTEQPTAQIKIEQRKEKEKTRPAHSSIYDITPAIADPEPETITEPQIFKVKQTTFETFSTLFSKSTARGSISWTAFEAAMADMNFSVTPKEGSIYAFLPPPDLEVQRPVNFHRPHKSRVEGRVLLIFASRLKKVYGWSGASFEVA